MRAAASAVLKRVVARRLQREHFDLLMVDSTELAALLSFSVARWPGVGISALHNIDSVALCREQALVGIQGTPSSIKAVQKVERTERHIARSYDAVLVCSEVDAALFGRLAPRASVLAVPNGVDTEYFSAFSMQGVSSSPCAPVILFAGTLAYAPNEGALCWFIDKVWPVLSEQLPSLRFLIVGEGPIPERLQCYASLPGVEFHVSVPDMRPYLQTAQVAVVPIRTGSGTRLKILEALAARVPVVSTTLGAEGLAVTSGTDILLADDVPSFAQAVTSVLTQPDLGCSMSAAGYNLVLHRYDWQGVRERCCAQILEVLQRAQVAT
jgi:glycosyltransferase involved in cell wall biosynthesis